MSYKSAEEVVAQGMSGQWIKPDSQFERDVIIESIPGCNLVRGQQGKAALRHYERDGYLVVCDGPVDCATHPDDIK